MSSPTRLGLALLFLVISTLPLRAQIPTTATQDLLNAYPGLKALFDGDRLVALYGVPMAPPDSVTASTDEFVQRFVNAYANAFGVDGVELVRDDDATANIHDGKFTVYTYHQVITSPSHNDALSVFNAVVKIPVMHLPDGTFKIGFVGIRLATPPVNEFPPDLVTSDFQAINIVTALPDYANLTTFTAQEMLYTTESSQAVRAWKVLASDDDEMYIVFVGAADEAILRAESLAFGVDVHGTVTGKGTNIEQPDPLQHGPHACQNPPVTMPLPGARVRLLADVEPACPSDGGTVIAEQFAAVDWDAPGTVFGPNAGSFEFTGVTLPARLYATLESPLVKVLDGMGEPVLVCDTVLPGTGDPPAVPLEFPSAGPPCPIECPGCVPTEYRTAQINAFLSAQAVHDFALSVDPALGTPASQWELLVNAGECVGAYTLAFRNPPLIFFQRSNISSNSNCPNDDPNFAFTTLVSHEYAHLLQARLFGQRMMELFNFREATADLLAAFHWNTPHFALDSSAYRQLQENGVQFVPEDGSTIYARTMALSGAVWDLRRAIINGSPDPAEAITTTNSLLADFMFISDGYWDLSLLVEVLIADDDDADLTSDPPTPHYEAIREAFRDHGMEVSLGAECPQDVLVDWLLAPAIPGVTPVAGVDYALVCDREPPGITLKTLVYDDGSNPPAKVVQWTVGRGRDEYGGARDLGLVWTAWQEAPPGQAPADIVVELGTNPNHPIRNVTTVEIPPPDETHWSNIILALEGSLLVRAGCYGHADLGGRISGTVRGNLGLVDAQAIGLGADLSGTLSVGAGGTAGELGGGVLRTIPAGSTLSCNLLRHALTIEGSLGGTVTIGTLSSGIVGGVATEGLVHVHGDIDPPSQGSGGGRLEVRNLTSAAIQIDGTLLGTVSVSGQMTATALDPVLTVGSVAGTLEILEPDSPERLSKGRITIGPPLVPGTPAVSGLVDIRTRLSNSAITGAINGVAINGDVGTAGRVRLGNRPDSDDPTDTVCLDSQTSLVIDGNVLGTLEIGSVADELGGDVWGDVTITGELAGTFSHTGVAVSGGGYQGRVSIGEIATSGQYIQSPNLTLLGTAPWTGSFVVDNDMAGSVQFNSTLQSAEVTIDGNIPGAASLTIRELYDSIVNLNLHACQVSTGGTVNIGHTTTIWQPSANGTVDMGDIRMFGDFAPTGRINFYGCKPLGVTWQHMSELCFEQHAWGQITSYLCKPKPQFDQCPATVIEDPCVQ
ncbi:MAG: hypothetical protein A49_23750 [Methyloceanibacter sp.]|nr:MAG: hypothetical protein A49_23750 [Methyloceanibacter sp.]